LWAFAARALADFPSKVEAPIAEKIDANLPANFLRLMESRSM
jgi:hypothetical protein